MDQRQTAVLDKIGAELEHGEKAFRLLMNLAEYAEAVDFVLRTKCDPAIHKKWLGPSTAIEDARRFIDGYFRDLDAAAEKTPLS